MYQLELNDLMFFIQSLKHPADHFNIKHFVSFSQSNTRSSTHNKLIHTKSPNISSRHFYFNRLPRLWNSLPPIDLDSSLNSIKSTLIVYFWSHFNTYFDSENPCTYHFQCPCSKYILSFRVIKLILALSRPYCQDFKTISLQFVSYILSSTSSLIVL